MCYYGAYGGINMDAIAYNVLIMITPKDFRRVESLFQRTIQLLPARKIIFVGSVEVGMLVETYKKRKDLIDEVKEKIDFLCEDQILSFNAVHQTIKNVLIDILGGRELPRGITGWYYQQFLKIKYSELCKDEYYLVWDGDTVPCKPFSMFREGTDTPYLDLKTEYHEDYFITLQRLLPGMKKCIKKSFVAEHMLINTKIMRNMIHAMEDNTKVIGHYFWEKIVNAIEPEKLLSNSFSEFETYGTFVAFNYRDFYRLRDWHSFRYGGEFFEMDSITEDDFQWLGRDFYAISFEKDHFVRDDHRNLFDNKIYQAKLTARQMLEICQKEFGEGSYQEIWDA